MPEASSHAIMRCGTGRRKFRRGRRRPECAGRCGAARERRSDRPPAVCGGALQVETTGGRSARQPLGRRNPEQGDERMIRRPTVVPAVPVRTGADLGARASRPQRAEGPIDCPCGRDARIPGKRFTWRSPSRQGRALSWPRDGVPEKPTPPARCGRDARAPRRRRSRDRGHPSTPAPPG